MIDVNQKTILHNIAKIKSKLRPNVRFCAVLKANAYSLGDVKIASLIEPHIDMFAVARLPEVIRLRNAKITKPILLLGVCEDFKTAAENNAIVTIQSPLDVRAVCDFSHTKPIAVHIAVNTGMNRFGLASVMQLRSTILILKKHPNVRVEGIYSHFSHESTSPTGMQAINRQIKRFVPFKTFFKRNYPNGLVHFACSGTMELPQAQFDMVRVGKAMYGGFYGYKNAIGLNSKVIHVHRINRGESVGYGGTFTAQNAMQVGVVQCGYADELFLELAKIKEVYIGKTPCAVLGRICMDNFMIDVTNIENPLGAKVQIIGNQAPLMQHVDNSNQSGAKLLCGLNTLNLGL